MDYLDFKSWKSKHSAQMKELQLARADSIFIFTRFTVNSPFVLDSKQFHFAESAEEAAGYIRHIFLCDILSDAIDDLQFELVNIENERQSDVLRLFDLWFKLGKIKPSIKKLREFCSAFNDEFSLNREVEYEIRVLCGVDELRKFLLERYSESDLFFNAN